MEDNEFEEVTIISHTDHGTSVLPQSTAERLMKEIKLEVTQKISQNENVKLGSLEGSTTPTLLDAIHQNVLSKESASGLGHVWNVSAFECEEKFIILTSINRNVFLIRPDLGTVKKLNVLTNAASISNSMYLWQSKIILFYIDRKSVV